MRWVLRLYLIYFGLQQVTLQMYVDRKVTSLLTSEFNEVFECRRILC